MSQPDTPENLNDIIHSPLAQPNKSKFVAKNLFTVNDSRFHGALKFETKSKNLNFITYTNLSIGHYV
jgi:hypothetical protein